MTLELKGAYHSRITKISGLLRAEAGYFSIGQRLPRSS
jgi:hypothetical protein